MVQIRLKLQQTRVFLCRGWYTFLGQDCRSIVFYNLYTPFNLFNIYLERCFILQRQLQKVFDSQACLCRDCLIDNVKDVFSCYSSYRDQRQGLRFHCIGSRRLVSHGFQLSNSLVDQVLKDRQGAAQHPGVSSPSWLGIDLVSRVFINISALVTTGLNVVCLSFREVVPALVLVKLDCLCLGLALGYSNHSAYVFCLCFQLQDCLEPYRLS